MRTFSVRCDPDLAEAVAARVAIAAAVEADWWQLHRRQLDDLAEAEDWPTARLAAARRTLAGEHARLREAGVLRGARGAWVLPALSEMLFERGWLDRRWRPLPPGARRGRPWGAGDAGYEGLVVLQLPDDVAELLVRACWWSSAPAVRALQKWYDAHGDHWRGDLHGGRRGWSELRPTIEELDKRDRWAAQITTTGQVLRSAMFRAVETHSVGG
ncbi:hypothetical protein [Krasilnikovia sp. MM14-A1259]|uniref:hypothetical protein n=1 Tax=Krasilnikovia sp. MM14-A1259 TaxID=3373539 RepID=UPI00399D3659